VSKIGAIKIKLHRPIAGTMKTLTIKREAGKGSPASVWTSSPRRFPRPPSRSASTSG
jgi:hypothetical protein